MVQRKTIEAHNIRISHFILLSTNIKCIFFTQSIKIGAANTIKSCSWLFKNLLLLFVNSTTYVFPEIIFQQKPCVGVSVLWLMNSKIPHTGVFNSRRGVCVGGDWGQRRKHWTRPYKIVNFSTTLLLILSHLKNPREIINKVLAKTFLFYFWSTVEVWNIVYTREVLLCPCCRDMS